MILPPAAALALAASLLGQAPAEGQGGEVRDLVILGETRPVLARFEIRAGTQTPAASWLDAVRAYLPTLDRDADGKVTPAEAEAVLNAAANPNGGAVQVAANGNAAPARPRPEVDRDKDGQISVAELAEALAALRPVFQVRVAGAAERRTDALFDQVDRDKDGKLGRGELAAIAGSLRRLDRDDDERISVEEIALAQPDLAMAAPAAMMTPGRSAANPPPPEILEHNPGESPLRLIRALFRKYDLAGGRGGNRPDGKLSPEEVAFPADQFDRLDGNHDGTLSNDEVRRYLTAGDHDLTVIATYSAGPGAPASIVAKGKEGVQVRAVRPDLVEVELGAVHLDFHLEDAPDRLDPARKNARAQFDAADTNGDGYLEASELTPSDLGVVPPFSGMMPQLDRNGDGRIYPEELDERVVAEVALAQGRFGLSDSDEGRSLLGLLDGDRDRHLGAREVLDASKRLAACDRDRDGQVAPEEIPHHLRVSLTRGELPAWVMATRAARPTEAGASRTAGGPDWFRKMDRNRDGDVSRREFLGTHDQFDRVDTDHDGLVSPTEAEAITPKPAGVKAPNG